MSLPFRLLRRIMPRPGPLGTTLRDCPSRAPSSAALVASGDAQTLNEPAGRVIDLAHCPLRRGGSFPRRGWKGHAAILSDFGFEVIEASGGREGILQFSRHLPGLILVDAGIPDMHAIDVLRHMRAAAAGRVQGLYCTTQFDLIEAQRANAPGATDLMVKPFDRHSLAARLKGARVVRLPAPRRASTAASRDR